MNIKILDKNGVTLKTKGKYCTEDISVAVDESILGGGSIKIPQVSDISLNTSGVLTWTAPSITNEEYDISLSYLINVNGAELETSETLLNVVSYIIEGENSISITTKAILTKTQNGDSVEKTIAYSAPKEVYTSLSGVTLNDPLSKTSAVAINGKIYIFGGQQTSYSSKQIQCYDPSTDTITTMSATLDVSTSQYGVYNTSAVVINNKAYVFGGQLNGKPYYLDIIQCYDPSTDTITTMSAKFPRNLNMSKAVAINNKAYVFYANTGLYCYDPSTDTVTTMGTTLQYSCGSAVVINNKAYVFGNQDETNKQIQCYDPSTDTVTVLEQKFGRQYHFFNAVSIGDRAYLLGGGYSGNTPENTFFRYDATTNTHIVLESKLTTGVHYSSVVLIENKAYVFGGSTESTTSPINTIQIVHNIF